MIFLKCSYHPNLIELQNAPLTYSLWWDGKVLKNPTYYVDFFQHYGTFDALDLKQVQKEISIYLRFHQIILKTLMIELINIKIEENAHKNAWRNHVYKKWFHYREECCSTDFQT